MSGSHYFVLAIIAIVFGSGLLKSWMHRRENHTSDEETDAMLGKIDALEERIRVLERIITENRYDLRQEIDNL